MAAGTIDSSALDGYTPAASSGHSGVIVDGVFLGFGIRDPAGVALRRDVWHYTRCEFGFFPK